MHDLVLNLIANRHSKRAFLKQEIPLDIVKNVLTIAGNAPSSKNTQPWQVAVVCGQTLAQLSQALLDKFDQNQQEKADYQYMIAPMPEAWANRAQKVGSAFFEFKGIDRNNNEQRREHQRQNYLFFGAPLELIFFLPKNAERGNFLDLGLYMQNVMLGLLSQGISSCPQVSIAAYPDTIRRVLGLKDDLWVVSGLACGYEDSSKVNTFYPERVELLEYASFYQ